MFSPSDTLIVYKRISIISNISYYVLLWVGLCYNQSWTCLTTTLKQRLPTESPLAARLRPRTLDEFVGQDHIIGEDRLLRRAIKADRLVFFDYFYRSSWNR